MKKIVVLSGGMDSTTVLAHALSYTKREDVRTLTFDYGSNHAFEEISAAEEIAEYYKVGNTLVELPFIKRLYVSSLLAGAEEIPKGHYDDESMKSTVVPNRNAILLSIAVGFAESLKFDAVIFGAHSGDHTIYPDCRSDFVDAFNRASQLGTYEEICVVAPFIYWTKASIVKKGVELGVPYELTYSCYRGRVFHCGKCGTCIERKEAFKLAEVVDPTKYE